MRLGDRRAWTASVLGTYEIHSKKQDVDLEAGDILTFEGGLGRSRVLLGVRAVPEFGAVNRTEARTLMVTLGYQAKLL